MKALFIILFTLIFSACSSGRVDLERDIAFSINKGFIERPEYSKFDLKVERVNLLKKERNYYVGTVEIIFDGDIYKVGIKVITDNKKLLWKIDNEALLFLAS